MAARAEHHRLTIEDFLAIDFGDQKAELDDGVIRMMAEARARHNRIVLNIQVALAGRLKGTGCTPYGSGMGIRTRERSLLYPDLAVFCGHDGPDDDDARLFDDPRVIFEALSAGTARTDLRDKLDEYKALTSVDTIVFVDIATERLRVVQRTGRNGWNDEQYDEPSDLRLPSLDLTLPHAEIFSRG
ncbi:MAG TPA: Uma2 family endonuclease [Sphingomonas sp.]|jgi:Uma2 family endonuclease